MCDVFNTLAIVENEGYLDLPYVRIATFAFIERSGIQTTVYRQSGRTYILFLGNTVNRHPYSVMCNHYKKSLGSQYGLYYALYPHLMQL